MIIILEVDGLVEAGWIEEVCKGRSRRVLGRGEGLPFKKAALKALGAVLMAAALLERREILRRAYIVKSQSTGRIWMRGEGRGKRRETKTDGTGEQLAAGRLFW